MKKIGLILLLSSFVLFLGACSKQVYEQEYNEVTGTITYHNPELDRGSGIETRADRIVLLNTEGVKQVIQLGCISSEESLELKSDVISPVLNQDKTYSFVIESSLQVLPNSISGKSIKAKITKPIFDYKLNVELPDRGRIGDCTADVNIKDIEIINN